MGEKTCLYTGSKRYAILHVPNHAVYCVTQETNRTLCGCSFTKHSCSYSCCQERIQPNSDFRLPGALFKLTVTFRHCSLFPSRCSGFPDNQNSELQYHDKLTVSFSNIVNASHLNLVSFTKLCFILRIIPEIKTSM